MFGLDELKQTRYFQDVQQEARQAGLHQGRQEGVQAGELALVTRQLAKRVGALDAAVHQQLQQLTLSQIEALGEALLDFRGIEDLRAWLAALPQRN